MGLCQAGHNGQKGRVGHLGSQGTSSCCRAPRGKHYARSFSFALKEPPGPPYNLHGCPISQMRDFDRGRQDPCLCLIQGLCRTLLQPCPVLVLLVTSPRAQTKHQLWKTIYFGIRVDLPKKTCSLRVTALEGLTPGTGSCKKKLATGFEGR